MSLDVVPLYCKWCLIVADKREDMVRHVSSYTRHRAVAKEKGLTEDHGYLVENRSAYVITEWDVAPLPAAEDLVHLSAASTKRGDFIRNAMEATYMEPAQVKIIPKTVEWAELARGVPEVVNMTPYVEPL